MSDQKQGACGTVVERLVEAGGRPLDAATEEHLGSCMACYRAMTELRDLPRVADALRAAAPEVPADERFWEGLAARTTEAAAGALGGEAPRAARPRGRWRARLASFGGLAIAAAAGWLLMVRHPAGPQPVAGVGSGVAAGVARLAGDEASGESLNDVAELDADGLRRLLERLGAHAPAALAGGGADATDAADIPADDEPRVSDEVAELDADSLRRVARSLERAAL
jgi:hypothetical protein